MIRLLKDELGKNPSGQNDKNGSNSCPEGELCPLKRFPLFYSYWGNTCKFCPMFAFIGFNDFITYTYNLVVFGKVRKILFTHMAYKLLIINTTRIPFFVIGRPFSVEGRNDISPNFVKVSTTNTSMFRQFHSHIISQNRRLL